MYLINLDHESKLTFGEIELKHNNEKNELHGSIHQLKGVIDDLEDRRATLQARSEEQEATIQELREVEKDYEIEQETTARLDKQVSGL